MLGGACGLFRKRKIYMPLSASSQGNIAETSMEQVERVLEDADWSYERDSLNTVHCIVPTRWGDMGGLFSIRDPHQLLQFSLTLDVKPTPSRRTELSDLIILINEQMPLGHFDYWPGDDMIVFRHAISMAGRISPEETEIASVIQAACDASDKFIPSMNYVIWAGKTATESMEMANFETIGEA